LLKSKRLEELDFYGLDLEHIGHLDFRQLHRGYIEKIKWWCRVFFLLTMVWSNSILADPGPNQAFRANNGTKFDFPQPATPDNPSWYYRTLFGCQAVEIPLTDLRQGSNLMTFYGGPQVCYGFNRPHYRLYAFPVRVYYQPSVAHASGSIVSPVSDSALGENPIFQVGVDRSQVRIKSVELIASYTTLTGRGTAVVMAGITPWKVANGKITSELRPRLHTHPMEHRVGTRSSGTRAGDGAHPGREWRELYDRCS
jgi:hypothetical protein